MKMFVKKTLPFYLCNPEKKKDLKILKDLG